MTARISRRPTGRTATRSRSSIGPLFLTVGTIWGSSFIFIDVAARAHLARRFPLAWASLLSITALEIFGSGIAFVLMGMLVGRVGSTRASFATYLIPVVAMGFGVWLRGDEVGPVGVVGAGLNDAQRTWIAPVICGCSVQVTS